MDAMELLLSRNSAPKLRYPAPNERELELIFQAAMRAPDHARLRPWRFLTIEGASRDKLGDIYAEALLLRKPESTEAELVKSKGQPLRAPMIIVVIASLQDHPKVPHQEQVLSAGCAAHGILLACHALGYAGVWRTGDNAFDQTVAGSLGLSETESVIGFLYIGSIAGEYKQLSAIDSSQYIERW